MLYCVSPLVHLIPRCLCLQQIILFLLLHKRPSAVRWEAQMWYHLDQDIPAGPNQKTKLHTDYLMFLNKTLSLCIKKLYLLNPWQILTLALNVFKPQSLPFFCLGWNMSGFGVTVTQQKQKHHHKWAWPNIYRELLNIYKYSFTLQLSYNEIFYNPNHNFSNEYIFSFNKCLLHFCFFIWHVTHPDAGRACERHTGARPAMEPVTLLLWQPFSFVLKFPNIPKMRCETFINGLSNTENKLLASNSPVSCLLPPLRPGDNFIYK